MEALIQEVLTCLPTNLTNEIQSYALSHQQTVESLVVELLNKGSYSYSCLERMTQSHRLEVITSPTVVLELARTLWKLTWQNNSDLKNELAV